jgi:hypothetical protein
MVKDGGGGRWWCRRHKAVALIGRWINGGDGGEVWVKVSGCRAGAAPVRLVGARGQWGSDGRRG